MDPRCTCPESTSSRRPRSALGSLGFPALTSPTRHSSHETCTCSIFERVSTSRQGEIPTNEIEMFFEEVFFILRQVYHGIKATIRCCLDHIRRFVVWITPVLAFVAIVISILCLLIDLSKGTYNYPVGAALLSNNSGGLTY
ncbi:hypothetical protein JAAARDRAFT_444788 [Jaapia argillacea MUCL 33604]|uniref:Uncharacterized protein n=1 Tax=Jaapia argillacea MUCL 33604 TaxID=933084 RepID=A0A067PG37_9AGAM|nr:hypothetical protein JAAARDRAFT_444788 [Jaapia argillacea MUCL 33604]